MAKFVSDLIDATNQSAPTTLTNLKSSGDLPPDFEIDGCSLTETSNGPYQPGDKVQLEMTWTGQEAGHQGTISGYAPNYSEQGSSGGEVTPAGTSIYPVIEYDVNSNASDGDYDIFATYDEPFNSGATNVGVQQSVTITVKGFAISLGAAPSTQNEIALSLDITSGDPDYDVLIERGTSSGGPYGTTVVNTTETSSGNKSYTDGGLNSQTTYYYKATVTENNGNGETLTDTSNATTL
jgi:hypothetical protein